MTFSAEFTEQARQQLRNLPPDVQPRLLKKLQKSVSGHPHVRALPLSGEFAGLWRFQIGDFRLTCQIDDDRHLVVVLNIRRVLAAMPRDDSGESRSPKES